MSANWRSQAQSRVEAKGGPSSKVLCPDCCRPMVLRNSRRGQFWGCDFYPACRGTRKVGEENKVIAAAGAGYEPMVKMSGSDEQEAIWDYLAKGRSHLVVDAGPGSGKTWTACQWCLRAPKSQQITIVAFNKHIAREANGKLAASKVPNARARTYHSLGYAILREHFKNLGEPDETKMKSIFEGLCPAPIFGKGQWRRKLNLAEKLSDLVKNYLIDYRASNFRDEMERLADHHGLEFNGDFNEALAMVPEALDKCKQLAPTKADFNDFIWLPVILGLRPRFAPQLMITDESQDLAAGQHELMFLAGASRLMVIGDKRQAIYEWRGASSDSMDKIASRLKATPLGVKTFPLTITRRCPKSHVRLAQNLFPDIQALPDAPEGEILSVKKEKAVDMMTPGDLVICRVNAELIGVAYALIRRKIRPIIKGKDIGKGLRTLIDKLEERAVQRLDAAARAQYPDELAIIREELGIYGREEAERLLKLEEKGEGRVQNLMDKCACMMEFITNAKTVQQIRENLEELFKDDDEANAVVLGTVHRTKGLEANRVFVLAPELLPHPLARKQWEKEGEKNICWIASTRAKFDKTHPGTLIFCGPVPSIFGEVPGVPLTTGSEETRGIQPVIASGRASSEFDSRQAPPISPFMDSETINKVMKRIAVRRLTPEGLKRHLDSKEFDLETCSGDALLKVCCDSQGISVKECLQESEKEITRHGELESNECPF